MKAVNIGILGGSFDPVHLGHLAAAADARAGAVLDRVVLVPAARAPLREKGPIASEEDRLAMLRAAADEPWLEISDYELHRGGLSYSIDTGRHFRTRWPDARLFWIIGADQLARLPHWRDVAELVRLVTFVALERPGHLVESDPVIPGLTVLRVPGRRLDISSTVIRQRLQAGESVADLVPHKVVVYLREKGLYR